MAGVCGSVGVQIACATPATLWALSKCWLSFSNWEPCYPGFLTYWDFRRALVIWCLSRWPLLVFPLCMSFSLEPLPQGVATSSPFVKEVPPCPCLDLQPACEACLTKEDNPLHLVGSRLVGSAHVHTQT